MIGVGKPIIYENQNDLSLNIIEANQGNNTIVLHIGLCN